VEAFLREGFAVRAMARDRRRLAEAFGDRAEIAVGDAANAASVDAAVEGCTGAHVCVAHGADETPAVEAIARAAEKHGLARISYVSGTSVCEENAWFPMVGAKLRAERVLRSARVPWTLFRPTWFMEALTNFFKHGRAVCFGRGSFALHFLASDDFAALVARAYASAEAENRAFRVLGPEPIPLADAIDRIRAALHPEIPGLTRMPFLVARGIAFLRGRHGEEMRNAAAFVRYFEGIEEGTADPDVARVLGPCPTTLEAWIARRSAPA
jgi:NADH dehydrogenase